MTVDATAVLQYITATWRTLTRSHGDIVAALQDSKIDSPTHKYVLYISAAEDKDAVTAQLAKSLSHEMLSEIAILQYSDENVEKMGHGLLYLPRPYVVPGGRFNEMYGWDSYFIFLGLLHEAELQQKNGNTTEYKHALQLAQDMVENSLYQIQHYGSILNANRSYYISRSQPPFISCMVSELLARSEEPDLDWLRSRALPAIIAYYNYLTESPHTLEEHSTLSRYFALGEGPSPEVLVGEVDEHGNTHFDRVRNYYREHYNEITDYDVSRYYDIETDQLTPLFYKGDRSMRESGFDPSNRFGVCNIDIIHYYPVCLNTLLFRMEEDVARFYALLGERENCDQWMVRAQQRKRVVNELLWDEEHGLYFDYNFESRTRRVYEFATVAWPLWAGIASPEQARRVRDGIVSKLEAAGGILTSTTQTGCQWDAPFGWAPLQLMVVHGLLRYGYREDALRIARKFNSVILRDFQKTKCIVEKYDVCALSSDVEHEISFGYSSNEPGFGWTNAVFLDFHRLLTADDQQQEQGPQTLQPALQIC